MKTALALTLILALPAYAQVSLDAPRRALLSGSEGQNVVRDTKGGLFLAGLGLTAAGLLLGGAGFAVLYVCREGQSCHDDKTLQTLGWALAAPGVLPLAVGLLLLYITVGRQSRVAMGVMPTPDGGLVASGAFRF
jgi:hypothetical protein